MTTHKALPFIVILLTAGGITACGESGDTTSGPSNECLSAMSAAADETDPELADPLIQESAYACESPEEWEAALEEYPGAMGLTEQADVSGSINTVCYTVPDAPACAGVE